MLDPNENNDPQPDNTPDNNGEQPPAPPESKPEPPAAPAEASESQVQEALKALKDIQERVGQGRPQPEAVSDATKIREQIKEQTGWTDEQIDFHQQSVSNAVSGVQEQVSWMQLERSHPDVAKYKEAMQKELADGYLPHQKANPQILEKVYYLAKGRAMESNPPSSRPAGQQPRVAPSYQGMRSGTDGESRPPETTLTDEQKAAAKFLRVPEEKYKRSLGLKNVETAETRKARQGKVYE